jgi:hypothetical protein
MSALEGNFLDMIGLPKGSWRGWKETSLFTALLMELTWISPWLYALLHGDDIASLSRVVGSLALVGLLTFLLLRLGAALQLDRNIRIATSLLVPFILLSKTINWTLFPSEKLNFTDGFSRVASAIRLGENLIPNEFLVAFALMYVWMRAIRWATADALPSEVLKRFKLGFVLIVIYLLIFNVAGQGDLAYFGYSFFFLAWLSLGSARLARAEAHNAAGKDFFTPTWFFIALTGLFFPVLILLFIGLGFESQFELVQEFALSLWLLLWGLVILILSPFIIAISWLFQYLLGRVDRSAWESIFPGTDYEATEETLEELANIPPPPFLQRLIDWLNSLSIGEFLSTMRPLLLWGIIAVILLVGLYFAARRIGFWKAVSDEMHDGISTEDGEDWWRLFGNAWRDRLSDLRQSIARFTDPKVGRRLLAAARIRRVYTYLMELSTDLGQPRRQAQTPFEFAPILNTLFPHHSAEIDTISNAYMRVRYGELDETPTDVIEVDRAWLSLRLEGEHIKKKRKKERLEAKEDES